MLVGEEAALDDLQLRQTVMGLLSEQVQHHRRRVDGDDAVEYLGWLLEPMILHAGFEIRDVSYSDDDSSRSTF
ncbi:MAG TPA: hypothetical protein VM282_20480 [Acidimicrobiales bacterium]|nr:hypothetical protein [Acidimicrobiales bacterium]